MTKLTITVASTAASRRLRRTRTTRWSALGTAGDSRAVPIATACEW